MKSHELEDYRLFIHTQLLIYNERDGESLFFIRVVARSGVTRFEEKVTADLTLMTHRYQEVLKVSLPICRDDEPELFREYFNFYPYNWRNEGVGKIHHIEPSDPTLLIVNREAIMNFKGAATCLSTLFKFSVQLQGVDRFMEKKRSVLGQ